MNVGAKRLFLGLGIVGIVAAAVFGATKTQRALQDRSADEDRASLRRCLFGTDLAPGERASERVERIYFSTVGVGPGALEAMNGTDWPSRCDVYADRIAKWQLDRGDFNGQTESAMIAQGLRTRPFATELRSVSLPAKLDFAWAMQPSSQKAPASVPSAPATAIVADDRSPVFADGLRLYGLEDDKLPSRDLRLVIQRDGSALPLFCRLAAKDGLRTARCAELAEAVGRRPEVDPSSEDDGPDFVSEQGSIKSRFFRASDGHVFGAGKTAVKGSGRKGDTTLVLQPDPEVPHELWLERYRGITLVDRSPVPLPKGVAWNEVRFVGDRLAWWSPAADGKRSLILQSTAAEGPALGAPEEALSASDGKVEVIGCRTDTALVVVAREGASHTLTFRDARGGSPAIRTEVAEGARLFCDRENVALVAISKEAGKHVVHDARCTRTACRTTRIDIDDFARADVAPTSADGSVAAAAVGDKVLVAWVSAKGGVRFRLAPADKLVAAKDVVLFDDWLRQGKPFPDSTIHEARVVARRDVAIVFLGGSGGVWAFRVDGEGKASPLVSQK